MFLADATYTPRTDLDETLGVQWQRLGEPGTWLTGEQRVDIAGEVRRARDCDLCKERKEALTPYLVPRTHTASTHLSAPAVDALHRMTTDPGRLTSSWFARDVREAGIPDTDFVEMVGIMAAVMLTDTVACGIGASLPDLPEVQAGEPTREGVYGAAIHSAWVPTVPPDKATGMLAEIYEKPMQWMGMVPNILRSLSLVPESLAQWIAYALVTYRYENLSISKAQTEYIASRVSYLNDCFY